MGVHFATLRQFIENITLSMALVDHDGAVSCASTALGDLLGCQPADLVARSFHSLLHPGSRQPMAHLMGELIEGSASQRGLLVRCLRGDGSDFQARVLCGALRGPDGRPDQLIVQVEEVIAEADSAELRFRARLPEMVRQAVIAIDHQGLIHFWNAAAEQLYGWQAEEVVGLPLRDLKLSDFSEAEARGIVDAVMAGHVWEGEFVARHRSGRRFPGHVVNTPIYDETGSLAGVVGISVDISDRRRAERALRESEELLRRSFEQMPVGILLLDEAGQVLRVNEAFCRITGLRRDDLLGEALYSPGSHAALPIEWPTLEQIYQGQREEYNREGPHQRPNGSTVWLRLSARQVRDLEDNLAHVLVLVEDITMRKWAELALRESNAELERRVAERTAALQRSHGLLATLINGLDDGLALLDSQGRLLAINRTAAALIDAEGRGVMGRPWAECCAAGGLEPLIGPVLATLDDHISRSAAAVITTRDGTPRKVQLRTLPQLGEGQVEALILHLVDITDKLQTEALLIQQERFEAYHWLAAIVTHEVNTPLQSIENLLYLAGRGGDPQRNSYLDLARGELQRASTLLRQLLDIHRPSDGAVGGVNLNSLARRATLLLDGAFRKRQVQVEVDLDQSLLPVWGRADELTQVLLNLLTNAMDAMPNGGRLRIQTVQDDPHMVRLIVTDTGVGIPPEVTEHIFTPFFTTRRDGTGLGLTICRRLIEQHNGTITVSSTPGLGSTFTVHLPIAETEPIDKSE